MLRVGACPELCPEVFAMGDDEKAHVTGPDNLVHVTVR